MYYRWYFSNRLDRKKSTQGCALRKFEGNPRLWTCGIQGDQYMISVKIAKICWSPMAPPMGPPSTVRAQSCHSFSHVLFFIFLSTGDVVFLFNIGMINQMRRLFSEFRLCLLSFKPFQNYY